tara:strand:- start:249 stop:449 length:201 start_codon:yes stop_codon:yes gene_type:complete
MSKSKQIYWNPDTIDHFIFISNYADVDQVLTQVEQFVSIDCELQGNDTEKDLVEDLMNKIYERRYD